MTTSASRYHDISVGHRVHGHESKCRHLHGHNYRVHFEVETTDAGINERNDSELDEVGRVLDFSVIKSRLCMWLEDNWDHKFLAWDQDEIMLRIKNVVDVWGPIPCSHESDAGDIFNKSLVFVPFNPTAENMAQYLVCVIGPRQLAGTGCILRRVVIEETRKCSCSFTSPKE